MMTKCVSMLLFALAAPLACQAFVTPGGSLSTSALGREGLSRSSCKVSEFAASFRLVEIPVRDVGVSDVCGNVSRRWYNLPHLYRAQP